MKAKFTAAALVSLCCVYVVHIIVEKDKAVEVERDVDDNEYAYDPNEFFADDTPDEEGEAPPDPKWHACRFSSKKTGQIYDLRPLSKNQKLFERVSPWFQDHNISKVDWVHKDAVIANQMYYLNVCADVILVPPACKALQKMDPSPAFDITPNGECYYLGTLKTFQWRPIDSNQPNKGMELYYENGEACGLGRKRKIKFVFTCAKHFTYADGPMVVFQHPNGCEYEVQWPSPVGCPADPSAAAANAGGGTEDSSSSAQAGKTIVAIVMVLAGLGVAAYLYKRSQKGSSDYSNL
jgi:hypothetical protein